MDSDCKRRGYDSTGRYHVPKPPTPETANAALESTGSSGSRETIMLGITQAEADCCGCHPVNIPLHVQKELFDLHAHQALEALPGYVHLYAENIIQLAAERLEEGYKTYGSQAFGWSPETRMQNLLEELADAVVYLVTGPVE